MADFYNNRKKIMDINRDSNQTLANINEQKRQSALSAYRY